MKPAVSVIIPVYKVEAYIGECVRSLFGQTLQDVEYIFVNDCTPDASMDVLRKVMEEYPQRIASVKVVDKPRNEGLPAARRSGLEAAVGEYVAHCDSDDWMEPDMLERMYSAAHSYDADGVVCGWMRNDQPAITKYTQEGLNCRDLMLPDIVAVGEMQSVWRYMFKREIYDRGVEFPLYNQGEDHALVVQLAYQSKSIYCVNRPLYHWRTNMASITNASDAKSVMNRFEGACANARQVEAFLDRNGLNERFAPQLTALKLYCMFYLRPLLRNGEGVDRWRNAFPEIKGRVLCNKSIIFTHKIEYLVDRYCPRCVIRAVYRLRSKA